MTDNAERRKDLRANLRDYSQRILNIMSELGIKSHIVIDGYEFLEITKTTHQGNLYGSIFYRG